VTPLLLSLLILPFILPRDPSPGLLHSKADSRRLDCERMNVEAGSRRYPGLIRPNAPRGEYVERSAVVCRERLMVPGSRGDQDEAILSTLDDRAANIADLASSLHPELSERMWLVETHYSDAAVSAKIGFATKNALVSQGLSVSDRTPRLAVGDVTVLTRMAPSDAWSTACQRYIANDSIGENDALLAVVIRDPRETVLHAGLCTTGGWTWLQ
jgi:hypothetical protein